MQTLFDIINNPSKSTLLTISGSIFGYIPNLINNLIYLQYNYSHIDYVSKIMQLIVWGLTSIVAIISIINYIEKLIKRFKKRKN